MDFLKNGITQGLSNLGTNIGDFFSNLGENLGTWFSTLGTNLANWFSDLGIGIGNSFTTLGNTLSNLLSYLNPFDENFFGNKLVELIGNLLNLLFVPQQDHFGELNEKFHSKFGFVDQVKELVTNLFNFNESRSSSDVPPDWSITYYDTTVTIIDWTAFEKYRGFLHGIIIFILWGSFLIRLYKRIPGIVHGYYVSHGD